MMKVELKEFSSISGDIDSIYHEAALKMGMTDSELDILYVICNQGSGCNQSALYKKTGMKRSTVNSAIRKMEKEELLYLTSGKGRNTCVTLTEKGEAYIAQTEGKLIEIENQIFLSWTQKEREIFIELNRRFAVELKEKVRRLFEEEP